MASWNHKKLCFSSGLPRKMGHRQEVLREIFSCGRSAFGSGLLYVFVNKNKISVTQDSLPGISLLLVS
jgi:hypothetical protein